jgi:uncharacterized protein (TIGR00661 family)
LKFPNKKTILVAPLNWGLGHATRCIPIINGLLENGYDVILGGDGAALRLLEQEFPALKSIALPSYNISYPEDWRDFKKSMFLKLPQMYTAAKKEKKVVKQLVAEGRIHGVISDNRLGVRNINIPSVYMTHQLRVLSGSTTFLSSKTHQKFIKKFDACWVPDYKEEPSLSGQLGHLKKMNPRVRYIGPLSRMERKEAELENDILILLSGPEPQRSLLEKKLISQFYGTNKKVLLVQGNVEDTQKRATIGNIALVNYLTTSALEKAINKSDLVICRSGYTSLMDMATMNKNVFFIPTPGQFEQEYVAKRLFDMKMIASCTQDDFSVDKLKLIDHFSGWLPLRTEQRDYSKLFSIFEGE